MHELLKSLSSGSSEGGGGEGEDKVGCLGAARMGEATVDVINMSELVVQNVFFKTCLN